MDEVGGFFYWINERHAIYMAKAEGKPRPWTTDPILSHYKFTNPFRELDRTTVWMRQNLTNRGADMGEMIFNCCVFRMFGTIEMSKELGWLSEWRPNMVKAVARDRLNRGLKVFTGAYIITNQGLKNPKEEVVCDMFLTPIWQNKDHLAEVCFSTRSLEKMHQALSKFQGWGGGGLQHRRQLRYFMATSCNAHVCAFANGTSVSRSCPLPSQYINGECVSTPLPTCPRPSCWSPRWASPTRGPAGRSLRRISRRARPPHRCGTCGSSSPRPPTAAWASRCSRS